MESGYYLDIIILFGFLHLSLSNGEMISLSCNKTRTLTSGNYPSDYGYTVKTEWNITAPINKGIAVVFEDFSTEQGYDVLGILDPERHFNRRNYSGLDLSVPPFLSTGSSLLVTFKSNGFTSYKGFRLALHCYDKSERTSDMKLENSLEANEGILEVYPDPLNQWLPICNGSWNSNLAEFTCRQLGFPGVYHFGSKVHAQYNKSACASIVCDSSNFLLQQCAWNVTMEDTAKASRLQCFNLAYRGCFKLPTNFSIYQRSADIDVGDCMYTCSSNSSELAAIMWNGCYCLNVSQSVIHNEIPDNKRCALEGDLSQGENVFPQKKYWAFHYDVTESCEQPGDDPYGSWSSNSTYLGSRLTLTCQLGYVINGSKSIECKPNANRSDWDKKIPHCQSLPRTTLQTTESDVQAKKVTTVRVIIVTVASVIPVVVLVCILMSCRYSKEKRCRTACRRNTDDINQVESSVASPSPEVSQIIHTYADMSNIPREINGPNASRLPSVSLSLSGVSSNLRQTTRVMPTSALVTDTDVDAYGYTLPGSESMRTSASASMMDRRRIDDDIDECGYQIPRKREESYYTEVI